MSDPKTDMAEARAAMPIALEPRSPFAGASTRRAAARLATWMLVIAEAGLFAGLLLSLWRVRADRPEIFAYGHRYLDLTRGVLATSILIATSVAAAWALRAAAAAHRRVLTTSLAVVVLGASLFVGLTLVEYSQRLDADTMWGAKFDPCSSPDGVALPCASALAERVAVDDDASATADAEQDSPAAGPAPAQLPPRHAGLYFAHYFTITAVHLFHVVLAIGLFLWLITRTRRGQLGADNCAVLANAVLAWQVIVVVWLYAFWLFYLSV
jgi:cytochrome c oxidase subunit 3